MRIAIAAYVTMAKQEGSTVYVCRPLVESQPEVRDPLLRVALQRLANKSRQVFHQWIEAGHADRVQRFLYDPDTITKKLKLQLVLRDRTVHWKLLFIVRKAFDSFVAFTPSIPDLWFGIDSPANLESRASEVLAKWCTDWLADHPDTELPDLNVAGDTWIEPVDLDLTSTERKKKKNNPFAALMGSSKMRGDDELRKTGRCLDDLASEYSRAVGREELVAKLDQILLRPDRQPILLVGPSGAGKTAIIEDCIRHRALRWKEQRKPGNQTWLLSPQRLISGMSYLGQWEERWLAILKEATIRNHVLYFDDPLGLLTAGITRDSNLSVADVLKSYLAQHRVHLLAEITPEALAILRRRDRALAECFHLLPVGAMDESTTLRILQQIVSDIEAERRVYFQPSVLPAILEKMRTLAPHLSFPGKGVEVIKNLSRWGQSSIQMSSLIAYLKQSTGVSTRMLDPTSRSHAPLRDSLEQRLVGQPQAIEAVERVAHRACYRLSPSDRPHGVLLFLGPTGVGKTECAKSLNAALFADESHLLRFDMNEITTSHAAEQLIGTFENPDGRMTAAVRRRPFSVLLLDEIEKAHPDVFDYLLQVIGEGRLTDAHGRTIDFRNTVIIMTSNLGVQEDQSNMGFESQSEGIERDRQLAYERSAQRFFRPEFFNRIDEVVVFRRLERKDIRSIAELQLQQLLQRDGMLRREIFARVQQNVMDWVVERGFDRELGARAIKRALETNLVEPLGDLLSQTSTATSLWADISLRDKQLPNEARSEEKETEELVKVSGPIRCRLHPLRNLSKPAPRKSHTLSEWISFAESKLATYTEHLSQLQKSIQDHSEVEDAPKVQSNAAPLDKVQYYTFHDQLFRCKEVLKELKRCATQGDTPLIQPMQSSPSAVKRNSTFRTAGERRHMIDYQSERDIHEAIADSHSFLGQARNVKESIDLMHRTLSLTHSMLEHVHQSLHWKLVMHYLTTPQRFATSGPETHPHPSGEDFALQFDNVQLAAVIGYWDQYSNPAANYLRALANTLSSVFQYEVSYDLRQPFELSVSGIGVAGLLKALAGTYRMESPILGRELGVLVAAPLSRSIEPGAQAKGPPWWDPYGPLAASVPFDWTEVRGTLGEVVDHYHSFSPIAFQDSRQRWGWWWNDLLPSVEP